MSSFQWTIQKKVPVQGLQMSKFVYHWVKASPQPEEMNFEMYL